MPNVETSAGKIASMSANEDFEAEFYGGPADGLVTRVRGLPEVKFPDWDGYSLIGDPYGELRPNFGIVTYRRMKAGGQPDGTRLRYEFRA